MTTAADPVAAFLAAQEAGAPVALATSGTAGVARSVVRSTDSWVSSFDAVAALTGLTARSRVWVPGPLTATMNLFAAVHATVAGAELVSRAADATHAQLTPSALSALLADAPARGLRVLVAGDRLAPGLHQRATTAGLLVQHYYGAAELSFVAWGAHADDLRPFPGVEVAVRDGEIWARSPYLCSGYDGPPGPLRRDADGFATVGDRGLMTDGRLLVHGRADAVTTGGTTVDLADVEPVLRAAAAGEVAVVGLPHDELGSVLAAVLTSAADHRAVRDEARRSLSGPHRPRLWFHVPDLPVNDAGKVDRVALAALVSGADGLSRRLV